VDCEIGTKPVPKDGVSQVTLAEGEQKAEGGKSADKPGSVVGNHSSGNAVTDALKQPTREQREPRQCSPIWPCPG